MFKRKRVIQTQALPSVQHPNRIKLQYILPRGIKIKKENKIEEDDNGNPARAKP